jgi:O-antigen/teichoic acid export membrane protein
LAKLVSVGATSKIWRLVIRSGAIAGAGALLVLLVMSFVGEFLIGWILGPEYLEAYPVVLLLLGAGVITMTGFGLSPALYAIGKPVMVLRVRLASSLVILAALYLFLESGGVEIAGWAAVAGAAIALWGQLGACAVYLKRATELEKR